MTYKPSSGLLPISAKKLFSNRERCRLTVLMTMSKVDFDKVSEERHRMVVEYFFLFFHGLMCAPPSQHNKRPGGNPVANVWFLESTPIQMPPRRGRIYEKLT